MLKCCFFFVSGKDRIFNSPNGHVLCFFPVGINSYLWWELLNSHTLIKQHTCGSPYGLMFSVQEAPHIFWILEKVSAEDNIMFEILKMNSDNCRGSCSGRFSDGLPDGIRVRLGVNVIHVIEDDNCTSVPLRRISSNKADRSRLVGDNLHTDILLMRMIFGVGSSYLVYMQDKCAKCISYR